MNIKNRVNEDDKPSIPSTKFIAFTIPINTKQENTTEYVWSSSYILKSP